jgi:hypothetical protein
MKKFAAPVYAAAASSFGVWNNGLSGATPPIRTPLHDLVIHLGENFASAAHLLPLIYKHIFGLVRLSPVP